LKLDFINSSSYKEDFLNFKGNFASKLMRPIRFDQTVKGTKFITRTSYQDQINLPANRQLKNNNWPKRIFVENRKHKSTMSHQKMEFYYKKSHMR